MTTDTRDIAAVEEKLWKEIAETRFGMLAPIGEGQHFQPMTTFGEPETGKLWFYTGKDTDLAQSAQKGVDALYVFSAKDRELQASIKGRLTTSRDQIHIDKFWGPNVSAWFPGGKDDPNLIMLCFDAKDAHLWVSDQNPLKYGFEVMKANLTKSLPDIGGTAKVNLG